VSEIVRAPPTLALTLAPSHALTPSLAPSHALTPSLTLAPSPLSRPRTGI
jgi:hypothetical protein